MRVTFRFLFLPEPKTWNLNRNVSKTSLHERTQAQVLSIMESFLYWSFSLWSRSGENEKNFNHSLFFASNYKRQENYNGVNILFFVNLKINFGKRKIIFKFRLSRIFINILHTLVHISTHFVFKRADLEIFSGISVDFLSDEESEQCFL